MRIRYLGHAGIYIETKYGSVLCDPWFNPAFFASWFPFPDNSDVDPEVIGNPDYLYISHQHRDHLDSEWLKQNVNKNARVLLPDFPLPGLKRDLLDLGFNNFFETKNGEIHDLEGLRVAIFAEITPSDGPSGDSGLFVDDGTAKIFNQNDSHPKDTEAIRKLGPLDAHFLQFSGAIWYPFVYNYPEGFKKALGARKRENQMSRALRFAKEIGARNIFPSAGPPCFLDDELFYLNDLDNDPSNIFVDQHVFLQYLEDKGMDRGHLIIPNSVATIDGGKTKIEHPVQFDPVDNIFRDKKSYLAAYRERKKKVIQAEKAAWPKGDRELLTDIKEWFEPLMGLAPYISNGINGRVLLDLGEERIVVDFLKRGVYLHKDELCRYIYKVERRLVEACVDERTDDWSNSLFLSCRFEAEREGPYNEFVYAFFKNLSPERIKYAEEYYKKQVTPEDFFEHDGYVIQKHCPHLQSDLTKFAEFEGNTMTCTMHGWQFDLETGRCLTSDDRKLHVRKK